MRDLLARPGFRRLLIGQAISGLGDWMATFALMVLVLDLTGSATAVGGVLVLRLLPGLVAAPIAARAGGRFGRRRVMLAMDLLRAGVAVALPLSGALWWVYGWAFVLEVASLVFLPARDSAVPVLVGPGRDEDRLGRANALVLASSYGGIPLGAGLFGLVFWAAAQAGLGGRGPYLVVFALDALSFLASYAAIRGIAVADTEDRPAESRPGGFLAGPRHRAGGPRGRRARRRGRRRPGARGPLGCRPGAAAGGAGRGRRVVMLGALLIREVAHGGAGADRHDGGAVQRAGGAARDRPGAADADGRGPPVP